MCRMNQIRRNLATEKRPRTGVEGRIPALSATCQTPAVECSWGWPRASRSAPPSSTPFRLELVPGSAKVKMTDSQLAAAAASHFQSLTRPRHPTARRDSDEGPIAGLGQVAAFYSKLMGHSAVWTAETHHLLLNQREGSQIGCHSGIDRAACSWASKRETAHEHLQRIVLGLIRRPRDLFMWIVKRRHASRAATRPVRCESSRLSQRV